MTKPTRREFLKAAAWAGSSGAALAMFPPSIRKALAVAANHRNGSIEDVEHIVIFMQENRSFDHYFGALPGVRGFADRFPIPVPDGPVVKHKTVWTQVNDNDPAQPRVLRPFHLDTARNFDFIRMKDTPHTWSNTQEAWDEGRMNRWPAAKTNRSMAYFREKDIPFQYALAQAFTVCDAYHCSFFGGTNPNRLFLWTGTNDPSNGGQGPAIGNIYDWIGGGDPAGGYLWTTYPERLEKAGVSWRIYQDMENNFSLNPLAGFKSYRDAFHDLPGAQAVLKDKALTTHNLDALKRDVLADRLPQVSWICATRQGSEHPDPSSPAQGANYTAEVLDSLTANPEVWSKTVLLLMYDENDGFFDHMPPPAPPSLQPQEHDPGAMRVVGGSTVSTEGEYHEHLLGLEDDDYPALRHRPYGLGPRVPMIVISPWSKGGWVNSQVFDHTSVLRFIEQRFGVNETNISPWRRTVCGDLTSAFDFKNPNVASRIGVLPQTAARAARATALPTRITPRPPDVPELPQQASGLRPSRPLPYALHAHAETDAAGIDLIFENVGDAGAVYHVYDRLHLNDLPRRYTVAAGQSLRGHWPCDADQGRHDLWVLGPNGFHRHFIGHTVADTTDPVSADINVVYSTEGNILLTLHNTGVRPCTFKVNANAYEQPGPLDIEVSGQQETTIPILLGAQHGWYDVTVTVAGSPTFVRRMAGRVENGKPSISDPAAGGAAIIDQQKGKFA